MLTYCHPVKVYIRVTKEQCYIVSPSQPVYYKLVLPQIYQEMYIRVTKELIVTVNINVNILSHSQPKMYIRVTKEHCQYIVTQLTCVL